MINSYKVEITVSQPHILHIVAETEEEAKAEALRCWTNLEKAHMTHYHEHGDPVTEITTVYDVTGTDDANDSPLNTN